MKLKSILTINSSDVLSSDELKSIIGGSWTSSCYCGYIYKVGSTTNGTLVRLVSESGLTETGCVTKCRQACESSSHPYCNTNNLEIRFTETGSGTGSGSGSGS